MPKKEVRERRAQERRERNANKSARLVESLVAQANAPGLEDIHLGDIEKRPRLGFDFRPATKTPISIAPASRFGRPMTWCARKGDCADTWGWDEPRAWSEAEWSETIAARMNQLEGLDWSEIQKHASGTGHLMHHDHDIWDLCEEAVERWIYLGLEEFETPFRFRIASKQRAWGVVIAAHFYMVWFERNHRIYAVTTD